MDKAKSGDTVKVHYTGTLPNGQQFDSSQDREPLEFVLGSGTVIQGFDTAVNGLAVGESISVTIPAEEAYGPIRKELLIEVLRSQLPEHIELKEGLQLQMAQPNGQVTAVQVMEVKETSVILDANHPLAGQNLTFALTLVDLLAD